MKFKNFSILILSAILLTSCSKAETVKSAETNMQAETENVVDTQYPIVVEHAFGESIIESKPQIIASVGWGNQDVALALGAVPVGMPKGNWGPIDENGILPWTLEAINSLGGTIPSTYDETDGIDFESVANTNPDVILAASSGLTQEDYDLLSAIAPVIAYEKLPWNTLWREQVALNAKGMGMEQEGIDLVKKTDDLIKEKTSAYSDFKDKTAMFAWIDVTNMGSFSVYTPKDPRASFLTDLGFDFPESVYALSEDSDSFYINVSAENAPKLSDVDILVVYGDKSMLEAMQSDALLGTIPAIKNGAVVFLEDGSNLSGASTQTVLSIPYTIDEYLVLIGEAVNKINE